MAPKSDQPNVVSGPTAPAGQSAFCRRPTDRRLVRHFPDTSECKLMEVRKYSAEYNDIDVKFRKPHLELITAYAVQNPFLYGTFDLRKDQLKARAKSRSEVVVKEKYLYYPTRFDVLEQILQNGFNSILNVDEAENYQDNCKHHVKFYTSSVLANDAFKDVTQGASNRPPQCPFDLVGSKATRSLFPVDTLSNDMKTVFYKYHVNEMYPDHVLVYRDLGGPNDERTSRLKDDLKFCYLAFRPGTRYNPEETEYKGLKDREEKAEAAKQASQSPVGYYNAQTDIKVQEEQRKKSSLKVANNLDDENNKKKKKFSFMSILSRKSSAVDEDSDRRSKKSFVENTDPESQIALKDNVDNSNLNAIVEVKNEEETEIKNSKQISSSDAK